MAQSEHRDIKSLKRYANLRQKHLADALAAIPSRRAKEDLGRSHPPPDGEIG
jgi:hypothetical protein